MTPEEAFIQFAKDAGRRKVLASVLEDPILQEAFSIVEELMEPKTGGQADAAPAMAASYFHQVAGANYFRRKLRDLTKAPPEKRIVRDKTRNARTPDDLPDDFLK